MGIENDFSIIVHYIQFNICIIAISFMTYFLHKALNFLLQQNH